MAEDGIIQMHIQNASNIISESDYGTHILIVYQNLNRLRDFYSDYIKKRIEKKNEIVHLAPFYETEDSVRKFLSERATPIDMQRWEADEKSLTIIDSLKKYKENDSPEVDNNFIRKLVQDAKIMQKAGVSIMIDTGVFTYKNCQEDLINYELALPSKYDIDLKRLCLFHQKDFDKLTDDQKQKLVNHHGIAICI